MFQLPFSINKKKQEEAEMIFESAISSKSSTVCIVVKGPTGCGKSFLCDKLIKKFGHLVRMSDSEIDNLPNNNTYNNYNNYSSNTANNYSFGSSSPKAMKCGISLFPSLSFSSTVKSSKSSKSTNSDQIDKRKVVSKLSDVHFYPQGIEKEYVQVRRSIEIFKYYSGILLIEMTEFEFEGSMNNYILIVLKETFSSNLHVINMNSCTATIIKNTLEPLKGLMINSKLFLTSFLDQFNGDPRAFFHDLYIASLKYHPNSM